MGRRVIGPSVLALALAWAPAAAQAQESSDDFGTLRVVATVGVVLADVGFLAGNLYFGSEGEWMPPYGAWTQLVLMTPANIAMGILTLDHSTEGAWLALGIGELVVGTWFAIHGTLSLLGAPDDPSPAPARSAFGLVPLPEGGAVGTWTGRL